MGENRVTGTDIRGDATQRNETGGDNAVSGGSVGDLKQHTRADEKLTFLGLSASGKLAIVAGALVLIAYFIYRAVG